MWSGQIAELPNHSLVMSPQAAATVTAAGLAGRTCCSPQLIRVQLTSDRMSSQAESPNGSLAPALQNGNDSDGGPGSSTQGAKLRRALSRTTIAPEGFRPEPAGLHGAGGGGGGGSGLSRTTIAADAFHTDPPAAPAATMSVSGSSGGGGSGGRDVLAALFVGHAPARDGGSPVGLGSGGVENTNPSPNTSPKPGAAALPQASPLAGGGELAGAVCPDPNPGPVSTARVGEPPRSPVRSPNLPRAPRDRIGLSAPPLLPDAGWCVLSP